MRIYLIVIGAIFLFNVFLFNVVTGTPLFFVFPAIGWGIGIAIHGSRALFPDDESIEKGARKLMRKRAEQREDEYVDWMMAR